MEQGIRITSPYFVAGVCLQSGIVTRAAPIVKYMIGWPTHRVYAYANKKHWTTEII